MKLDFSGYGLKRKNPADITDNPITMFSRDWALVAAGNRERFNALTVAWGALGTAWGNGRPLAIIFVSPSRFTHEFLEREKGFSINVLPVEFRKIMGYMGSRSGRDEDKIAESGLEYAFTERETPVFTQSRLILNCEKIYSHTIERDRFGETLKSVYAAPVFKGVDPHTVYFGEITDCWARD
ncbi:MAG: flavin reductase [Desulfovibrio sp.]|nr:flavin reductase [Desulfovibrio sp.]